MNKNIFIGIGPAARILEKCPDTLRNWDKSGFFKPARDAFGRRIYSEQDLKELQEKLFPKRDRDGNS
jgi:DNA-binding transcriptional MerR regulator